MRFWLTLSVFILSFSVFLSAAEIAPFQKWKVITTKYFDIIFCERSKQAATYLASFADRTYEKVVGLLKGIDRHRITVVISPDYEAANGFSIPVPYNTMMLYDYPAEFDGSIGNYRDALYDLFIHELTHAISFNIRPEQYQVLRNIFGAWVMPVYYMMPWSMIEGVTTSFESLDGYGRVNNPFIAESLLIDRQNGRFKTLDEASGPYSVYPWGTIPYYYGGYFSAYLQKKYGMDKYAAVWKEAGWGNIFWGIEGIFYTVYGTGFAKEWDEFSLQWDKSLTLKTNGRAISKDYESVETVDWANGRVYYFDSISCELRMYDEKAAQPETILVLDGNVTSIDVAEDASRILINRYVFEGGFPKLTTQEYDLNRRCFLPKQVRGLRQAAYFNSGYVAIKPNEIFTDIALEKDGKIETLVRGSESVYFDSPKQWTSNEIVFLMRSGGTNSIAAYNIRTGVMRILLKGDKTADYFRNLQTIRGDIVFGYNADMTLTKFGTIHGDKVYLQTENVAGGAHFPIPSGDKLYFTANYPDGMKLSVMPMSIADLKCFPIRSEVVQTPELTIPKLSADFPVKDYCGLGYLMPQMWIPIPDNKSGLIDSVGILTYMVDPTRENIIMPTLSYNFNQPFLNWDLTWQNSTFPVLFGLSAADRLRWTRVGKNYSRDTSVTVSLSYSQAFLPTYFGYGIGASAAYIGTAYSESGNPNAYTWKYQFDRTIADVYFTLFNWKSTTRFFDYEGFRFVVWGDYNFQNSIWKAEARFTFDPPVLPLLVSFYGAISDKYLFYPDARSSYFGGMHYPYSAEYSWVYHSSYYYLYAMATIPVFNIEIQRGLGSIPLFFNSLNMTAGYRVAYARDVAYQSVYVRLSLYTTVFWQVGLSGFIEGNYAINTGKFDYSYNYSLDTSFLSRKNPEDLMQ